MWVFVKYLQERNGWLHYRRAIPPALQQHFGKREFKEALGLRSHDSEAAILAIGRLAKIHDRQIREAQKLLASEPSEVTEETQAIREAYKAAQAAGILNSSLDALHAAADLNDYREQLARRAFDDAEARLIENGAIDPLPNFATGPEEDEYFGEVLENMSFRERALFETFKNGKLWPGTKLTLRAAYDRFPHWEDVNKDRKPFEAALTSFRQIIGDPDIREIKRHHVRSWISERRKSVAEATIKRQLTPLRVLTDRVFDELEIQTPNPFKNPGLRDTSDTKSKKQPFHKAHLKLIDKFVLEGPHRALETRAALALLRNTGARLKEIAFLRLEDVRLDDDVPHILITPHEGNPKLKTEGSKRLIPLVGFAPDFMEKLKRNADGPYIFTDSFRAVNSLSQRLNKAIRNAGIPKSKRLSAYCFRHTLVQAFRDQATPEGIWKRITGHAGNDVAFGYGGSQMDLAKLAPILADAVKNLGEVSVHSFDEFELPRTWLKNPNDTD